MAKKESKELSTVQKAEADYNKFRQLYFKAVEDNQRKPDTEGEELYWAEKMCEAANRIAALRKAKKQA